MFGGPAISVPPPNPHGFETSMTLNLSSSSRLGYPGGAGIGFFSPGAFLLFDALAVVFGFFGVLFGVVVFGFFGVVVFAGAFASASVVACASATRGRERG